GLLHTSVVDQGAAGDGSDNLLRVEQLQFSDHAFSLAGADLNHAANFDGQRFDDVLFQSNQTGQVVYAVMNAGNFTGFAHALGSLPATYVAAGHGDVNGDGFADVVVQDSASGAISVATQHGTGTPTWMSVASAPGYTVHAVADVNGDSFADIVIENLGNGQITYANIAGGSFSGWVSVSTVPGWNVVGAGDINGDGYADIVIQNASGQISYANMAGGVFSGWGMVANVPGW